MEIPLRFSAPGEFACLNLCDEVDVQRYDTGHILVAAPVINLHLCGGIKRWVSPRGFTLTQLINGIFAMADDQDRNIMGCAVCSSDAQSDLVQKNEEGQVPAVYVILND